MKTIYYKKWDDPTSSFARRQLVPPSAEADPQEAWEAPGLMGILGDRLLVIDPVSERVVGLDLDGKALFAHPVRSDKRVTIPSSLAATAFFTSGGLGYFTFRGPGNPTCGFDRNGLAQGCQEMGYPAASDAKPHHFLYGPSEARVTEFPFPVPMGDSFPVKSYLWSPGQGFSLKDQSLIGCAQGSSRTEFHDIASRDRSTYVLGFGCGEGSGFLARFDTSGTLSRRVRLVGGIYRRILLVDSRDRVWLSGGVVDECPHLAVVDLSKSPEIVRVLPSSDGFDPLISGECLSSSLVLIEGDPTIGFVEISDSQGLGIYRFRVVN